MIHIKHVLLTSSQSSLGAIGIEYACHTKLGVSPRHVSWEHFCEKASLLGRAMRRGARNRNTIVNAILNLIN